MPGVEEHQHHLVAASGDLAGLRFDLGRLSPDAAGASLAVNATNLLDERYVSTCLSATGCYWGPGRAVTASIKYRW